MNKEKVVNVLNQLKSQPKRKFTQSYDLTINLKNLVIKQNPVDVVVTMPHPKGRTIKVAAFVNNQLSEQAEKNCDLVITEADFAKYKDKKEQKKLAKTYDYFISQSTLMPKVAANFGKTLGTQGKMPNPKLGCVVPPTVNLEPLIKKLSCTVRLQAKKATNLQCIIGKESMPEEELIDNILSVIKTVTKALPNEKQNIKNISLKQTMGKPVML